MFCHVINAKILKRTLTGQEQTDTNSEWMLHSSDEVFFI